MYRKTYKQETDDYVLSQIGDRTTVDDLCKLGIKPGMARNSLKRLYDAGKIELRDPELRGDGGNSAKRPLPLGAVGIRG